MSYRTVGMIDAALGRSGQARHGATREIQKRIEEYAVECSILKVWGSEMLDKVVDHMVQIYAGYGYVEEYPAERAYRDARINRIFEGTNEINRLIITGLADEARSRGKLPLLPAIKQLMDEVMSGPSPRGRHRRPTGRRAQAAHAGQEAHPVRRRLRLAEIYGRPGGPAGSHGRAGRRIIEVFAMESCILRAEKLIANRGEAAAEQAIAMTQLQTRALDPHH